MSWALAIYTLSVIGVTVFFVAYLIVFRRDREFYRIIFLSDVGLFFIASVALAYVFAILSLLAISATSEEEYKLWIRASIISVRWGILLFLLFLETLRNERPNLVVTSLVSALVFSSSITFLFRSIDASKEEGVWVRTVPFRNVIDLMDSSLAVCILLILAVELVYTIYIISRIRSPKTRRLGLRMFFVGISIIFFGILVTLVTGLVIREYTIELILLQYFVLGTGAILVGMSLVLSPYIIIAATTRIIGVVILNPETLDVLVSRFYTENIAVRELLNNIRGVLKAIKNSVSELRMVAISGYKILIHHNALIHVLIFRGQYRFIGKVFDVVVEKTEKALELATQPERILGTTLEIFDRFAPAPSYGGKVVA